MKRLALLMLTASPIFAQTSIPVSGTLTLSGTLDASGATASKPMKQGTTLPATCAVGEQYFKTDATAGSNLYGCTATNTWTAQAGSAGTGDLTAVTAGNGISVTSGTGPIPDVAIDTNVTETRANNQSGADKFCDAPTGTAGAQTCALVKTLTAYTDGMRIVFEPGTTNTTTQTLNIDTLGVRSILKHDGTALAAGDLTAARKYTLTYHLADTTWRLPAGGSSTSAAMPYWTNVPLNTSLGNLTPLASSQISYMRVFLPGSLSVGRIGFWQNANGAAGCAIGIALYDPTTRARVTYVNAGCVTGSGGAKTVTTGPTSVPAGEYLLAWAANDATAGIFQGVGASAGMQSPINAGTTKSFCTIVAATQAYDGSAMPATLDSSCTAASVGTPGFVFSKD